MILGGAGRRIVRKLGRESREGRMLDPVVSSQTKRQLKTGFERGGRRTDQSIRSEWSRTHGLQSFSHGTSSLDFVYRSQTLSVKKLENVRF